MDIQQEIKPHGSKSFLDSVVSAVLLLILVSFCGFSLIYAQTHSITKCLPGTEEEFKGQFVAERMLEGYSREQAEALFGHGRARAIAAGGWPCFQGGEGTTAQQQEAALAVFDQRVEELHQEIRQLESQKIMVQELKVEDLQRFDVVLSSLSEEQQRRSRIFTIVWSLFTTSVGAVLGFLLRAYTPPDILALIKRHWTGVSVSKG